MTLPEPLDPESTDPERDPTDDWDDDRDDYEWLSQDPVLPRPAAVPCEHPQRCQWRPYPDTERWIRCGTHGCGVEYDLAADELPDDDGAAEASRWQPVRTVAVVWEVL
jgi:hypothetical protein